MKLVFDFTMANLRESITLAEVEDISSMSVPAFCNWFKKSTKKTYVDFLNEIKIGHAYRLLLSSKITIPEIGYDSGYTANNFHKQFLKVKGLNTLQ
ncbi:AraC family transcriptional regulator [Pedobacter sp. G11]|uniref:helix-turn-helix domain-containing protein n=1 Tax=Pedobacter sp. G11 TaxID=2482728 RepID=UPI000F5F4414|nr:AraC family transcriptional regulator [Pedobacter sp. G11]AZI26454.1 AraC family transcriptional regulator [Pedobacter sp. G11]